MMCKYTLNNSRVPNTVRETMMQISMPREWFYLWIRVCSMDEYIFIVVFVFVIVVVVVEPNEISYIFSISSIRKQ